MGCDFSGIECLVVVEMRRHVILREQGKRAIYVFVRLPKLKISWKRIWKNLHRETVNNICGGRLPVVLCSPANAGNFAGMEASKRSRND